MSSKLNDHERGWNDTQGIWISCYSEICCGSILLRKWCIRCATVSNNAPIPVQCSKEKAYEHEASSGIGDVLLCGKYLPIKEKKNEK